MKQCTKCGETKSLSDYYKDRRSKDGHTSACKVCVKERTDAYAEVNREKLRLRSKENYYRNTEKHNERMACWQKRNPDKVATYKKKYREDNKTKVNTATKKWAEQNKDQLNFLNATRKARKKKATPSWLSKTDLELIKTEYSLAHWCSKVMAVKYHVDHVVPLQGKKVCGLHVPWNLRVIPATENLSKGNKHVA